MNAQYTAFDPDHKPSWSARAEELPYVPISDVTWMEACSFCRWLAVSFPWARGARLPTEEEWEYACRAGTHGRYWNGNDAIALDAVGWYDHNSFHGLHRVGEKLANPWGLYDTHGNVWEWTLSLWTDSYAGRENGVTLDPAAVEVPADESPDGTGYVMRGGCYWGDADWARAAYRVVWNPAFKQEVRGFRIVLPAAHELSILARSSITESLSTRQSR